MSEVIGKSSKWTLSEIWGSCKILKSITIQIGGGLLFWVFFLKDMCPYREFLGKDF